MKKPCILIADDDKDLVNVLAARCEQLGLSVITAHRGLSAFNAAVQHRPDVICLDVNMPAGDGMNICEMLADDPVVRSTPIIMLTGSSEPKIIRRCHDLCAYYVQKCPNVWQRIKPLLCELFNLETDAAATESAEAESPSFADAPPSEGDSNLLDAVFAILGDSSAGSEFSNAGTPEPTDKQSRWILHIEDDQDLSAALSMRLQPHGFSVLRAFNGMEGYRRAFMRPASAIILDMELPNGNGDYVMRRLKENPVTKDIPVIVLTGKKERSVERKMMNLGVDVYLTKPLNLDALLAALQQVSKPGKAPNVPHGATAERQVSPSGEAT